jgi:hypothetical protein
MIAVDIVACVESSIARFLSGGARGIGPVCDTVFVTTERTDVNMTSKKKVKRCTPQHAKILTR